MSIDSLLEKLKDSGLGCHVGRVFAGAFANADVIALVLINTIMLRYVHISENNENCICPLFFCPVCRNLSIYLLYK